MDKRSWAIGLNLPNTRWQRLWADARRDWPIWLVTGVTLLNGALAIVTVLLVRPEERPELFALPLPFGLYHWSRSLTLVFGFALMYVSSRLFQRRRVALWLALAGATLTSLTYVGRGRLWYAAFGPAVTLVLLLLFRRRFTVRSEPRSIAQGFGLMVASFLVALAYGVAGFWLLDLRDFGLHFTLADALLRTLRQFTLVGNSDLVAHTHHARWFLTSLDALGVAAGTFALYGLFRPVAYHLQTLPHQRSTMRLILKEYGGTAVDYFKLWPAKSYFFSQDAKCGIAYRVSRGVALSLGDPVGAAEELEDTLHAFLRFCADNGWAVAFHQALPEHLPVYRRLGLGELKIGEEAVVNLERFATETLKHDKRLRYVRTRFERDGYRLVRHVPPHDAALLDQLEGVSNEWLQIPGRRERSFSLGRFDRRYLNECVLDVIEESAGGIVAFASEVPSFRAGEIAVDLMRHRLEVPNSTMEYLFIATMLELRDEGYCAFNLGMAPYAGVGDEPDAPLEERTAHQLAEHLTRFGSYKGIRDYKAKFAPEWQDRFLVYEGGPLGLVKAALALVQATDRSVRD